MPSFAEANTGDPKEAPAGNTAQLSACVSFQLSDSSSASSTNARTGISETVISQASVNSLPSAAVPRTVVVPAANSVTRPVFSSTDAISGASLVHRNAAGVAVSGSKVYSIWKVSPAIPACVCETSAAAVIMTVETVTVQRLEVTPSSV